MRRSPLRFWPPSRSWLPAVAGAVLAAALGSAAASPAVAGTEAPAGPDAYKYWGYYHSSGGDWEFATEGAHQYIPKDGSVEGWRYGLDTGGTRLPRVAPDFNSICGDQTPTGNHKLVAVVIDYGIPEEAEGSDETPPARGACADVPAGASGQQVLQTVADTTIGDAGIASIDGYPSVPTAETFDGADIPASEPPVELELADETTEADATTDEATDEEAADEDDGGAPWALIGVGAVAVVIAGAAVVVARRRA